MIYSCPKCKSNDELRVTFAEVFLNAHLTDDGFVVSDGFDGTDNERVYCGSCGHEADMNEFVVEYQSGSGE